MNKTSAMTFSFVIGLIVGAGGFFLIIQEEASLHGDANFNTQSLTSDYRCQSSRDGSSYYSDRDESGTRRVVYSTTNTYESFSVTCTEL